QRGTRAACPAKTARKSPPCPSGPLPLRPVHSGLSSSCVPFLSFSAKDLIAPALEHFRQAKRLGLVPQRPHSSFVANRAPSTIASNLAQQISASPTREPTPQSVPATIFSRPTSFP